MGNDSLNTWWHVLWTLIDLNHGFYFIFIKKCDWLCKNQNYLKLTKYSLNMLTAPQLISSL